MSNIFIMQNHEISTKKTLFKTYQFLWYSVSFIEFLLIYRIIFRLLSANPASGFVAIIYNISEIFVLPFNAIFPTPAEGGYILDTSALVAALVYPTLAYLIMMLLQLFKPTTKEEAESVDNPEVPDF